MEIYVLLDERIKIEDLSLRTLATQQIRLSNDLDSNFKIKNFSFFYYFYFFLLYFLFF